MIKVSKINKVEYYINDDLIETIEETPDTVLTLTSGKKLVVLEPPATVIARIIQYRKLIAGVLPMVKEHRDNIDLTE